MVHGFARNMIAFRTRAASPPSGEATVSGLPGVAHRVHQKKALDWLVARDGPSSGAHFGNPAALARLGCRPVILRPTLSVWFAFLGGLMPFAPFIGSFFPAFKNPSYAPSAPTFKFSPVGSMQKNRWSHH
jgi:hypothetical protein